MTPAAPRPQALAPARDDAASVRAPRRVPRLLVPGLRDSGPVHWQTHWERTLPGMHRLRQDDWYTPDLERWASAVARAIDALRVAPVVVAHSFGCLAAVHAATWFRRPIAGLLLVAPADPERFNLTQRLARAPLPFPVTLVASSNDPWLRLTRAGQLAMQWRARFVAYAGAGHINAESGFGPWPEGHALLRSLERDVRRTPPQAVQAAA
jgi:predicted alpha/beta hydrolase family esterase